MVDLNIDSTNCSLYLRPEKRPFPKVRAIHDPKQIKSVDELVVGSEYLYYYGHQNPSILYEGLDESLPGWIRVTFSLPGLQLKKSISLSDCGLLPYKGGTWNPNNYLMPKKSSV